MEEIDKQDIVTINLKYGSSLKPLKTLAFAQLSAKALFLCGSMGVSDLTKEIARLIGIRNLSEDLVIKGLNYLLDINKVVVNRHNEWILRNDAKKEIAKDLELARYQVSGVLKRHFSTSLDGKKLKAWFIEAVTSFFGHYGDEWVSAISKGVDKKLLFRSKTVEELLLQSITNHKLENVKQPLIDGFIKFLSSDDNSDQQYLMLVSQAMFSARLVAADVGMDPITLQELRDAKFILDTNVLFSIALESSVLAKSINSLEGALKALNSRLVYLHTTKDEYERALLGKRGEVIHVVKIFPDTVLSDVRDDFLTTAKSRGCVSIDDYERFFNTLVNIPESLPDGHKIVLEDDNEIEEIRKKAEDDGKLKSEIKKFSEKFRPKWRGPKREAALRHDAVLLRVADFFKNEGNKCWILSLDYSLQAYAINKAGPHDIPGLLSISALIEILAINNAGPELDASNFAPLLAKIILNECMPPVNTYTIQDLITLHKINEKSAELPPEDIKGIVIEVTKARIEGKLNSAVLELKVNRMYQDSTMHITEKLEEARRRASLAEEDAKEAMKKKEDSDSALILIKVGQVKNKALAKLILWIIGEFILAALVSFLIFSLYKQYVSKSSKLDTIGFLSAVLPSVIGLWMLIPKAISNYRKVCKEAKEEVLKSFK